MNTAKSRIYRDLPELSLRTSYVVNQTHQFCFGSKGENIPAKGYKEMYFVYE